jgi:hypothetical protein
MIDQVIQGELKAAGLDLLALARKSIARLL